LKTAHGVCGCNKEGKDTNNNGELMVVHKIRSKKNPASTDAATQKPIPLTTALLSAVIYPVDTSKITPGSCGCNVPDYDAGKNWNFSTATMDACRIPRKQHSTPNMVMMMTTTTTQSWNSSMAKQLEFTMWRWHYLNGKMLKSIPVPPRISNRKSGCEKQEWQKSENK